MNAARRCGIRIDERTAGRTEVQASCPFCGDKPGRYHLSLNAVKNQYKCFLCGASGNSVSLYARLQNISFGEAAKELLSDGRVYPMPKPKAVSLPENTLKPLSARDAAYREMLDHLALSSRHLSELRDRGLSDERIERNMYRSLPANNASRLIIAQMLSDFINPEGLPGFYRDKAGRWNIAGKPGLLIPYRDPCGLIQGLQIRLDDFGGGSKYRWLSGAGMKSGVGSGTCIHITGNTRSETAYITEGALKGDAASFHDGDALFLCFAGINAIGGLRETIKALGVREAVIAGDMDKLTNWRVQNGLDNIAKTIAKAGVRVRTINWNPSCKGIDDYYLMRRRALENGKVIRIEKNRITESIRALWEKERPALDAGFIETCEWELNTLPFKHLTVDPPKEHIDPEKVRRYKTQMAAGKVFPPLVAVNGAVIDGFHRCIAYRELGVDIVRVYQNAPPHFSEVA